MASPSNFAVHSGKTLPPFRWAGQALLILSTACALPGCTLVTFEPVALFDQDGDGVVAGEDCNDQDASQGAQYIDHDGDGYGTGSPLAGCSEPDSSSYASRGDDCDDAVDSIYPGAQEVDNGKDDDCSGSTEQCDDNDPATSPTGNEICDGKDNDCDGETDPGFDGDDDGYLSAQDCPTLENTDCDDADAAFHPDAPELCDGVDNDCDEEIDEGSADQDQDGWRLCEGDCDDNNDAVNPGIQETCNDLDENCSGGDGDYFVSTADTADGDLIQDVLKRAANKCSVVVAPGDWPGPIDFLGKSIHLRPLKSAVPGDTRLVGGKEGPIVIFQSREPRTSILGGFTLLDGTGVRRLGSVYAGAVMIDGASPTLQNNLFTGNRADFGGAIYATDGGPELIQNTFASNSGGVQGTAVMLDDCSGAIVQDNLFEGNQGILSTGAVAIISSQNIDMTGNIFRNNSAQYGAALSLYDGATSVNISSNEFEQNEAVYGGAIYAIYNDGSLITDNLFEGNAADYGGAYYLEGSSNGRSLLHLTHNSFFNNSALLDGGAIFVKGTGGLIALNTLRGNETTHSSDGRGGALFLVSTSVEVSNNLLQENSASQGGALFLDEASAQVRLINNTLVKNSATVSGGGIFLTSDTPSILNNLITFASSGAGIYFASPQTAVGANIQYNDFFGNAEGVTNAQDVISLLDNLNEDPLFTDLAGGDFTLSSGSPARDAGNPSSLYTDVDGSRNDMGMTGGPEAGEVGASSSLGER